MPKHTTKKVRKRKNNVDQNGSWYKSKTAAILFSVAGLLAVAAILWITGVFNMQSQDPKSSQAPKSYNSPVPMIIDVNKKYVATIKTAKGDLVLDLYPKDAPVTVNNFVTLARKGFYNGVTFHRIIPGFMAQGGDPTGTGGGGPGYKFQDEFSQRTHVTGALSMANSGPNTNGSQFFICYAPQPHLNGKHTVFGQLTQGMDVLTKLVNGDKMTEVTIAESN
jgi:peptidyl-prolyl cis-trans isomerase B (cyclophilin B)